MNHDSPPSFSVGRRWSLTLNVLLSVVAVLALVAMINYLAARHFVRLPVSELAHIERSPLTRRVIASVTNDVKVIIYFSDTGEPLYKATYALLKEYKFANSRIDVEAIEYIREPAAANLVKAKYKLNQPTDKNNQRQTGLRETDRFRKLFNRIWRITVDAPVTERIDATRCRHQIRGVLKLRNHAVERRRVTPVRTS